MQLRAPENRASGCRLEGTPCGVDGVVDGREGRASDDIQCYVDYFASNVVV